MTQQSGNSSTQSQDQRQQAEQAREEISRFLEEKFKDRTVNISEVTQAVRSMPVDRLLNRQTAGAGTGSSNKS